MAGSGNSGTLEEIELELLLDGVFRQFGCDFRQYAHSSLKRRISNCILSEGLSTISELQNRVLHHPDSLNRLLRSLSVKVTSMYRDPSFYLAFRKTVVPLLRTYPFVRIWHAGCSTGEEVYSMAILLEEEGLYDRSRIYATDMNEEVVKKAQAGIFPLASMKEYTTNYLSAGGKASFSEYYTANYDKAVLRPSLKENIVFSQHNLATDSSFNEFNVIFCRNVMIYFNSSLQERTLCLFHESLVRFGILALGRKESLKLTPYEKSFEPLDAREKLYRRIS